MRSEVCISHPNHRRQTKGPTSFICSFGRGAVPRPATKCRPKTSPHKGALHDGRGTIEAHATSNDDFVKHGAVNTIDPPHSRRSHIDMSAR